LTAREVFIYDPIDQVATQAVTLVRKVSQFFQRRHVDPPIAKVNNKIGLTAEEAAFERNLEFQGGDVDPTNDLSAPTSSQYRDAPDCRGCNPVVDYSPTYGVAERSFLGSTSNDDNYRGYLVARDPELELAAVSVIGTAIVTPLAASVATASRLVSAINVYGDVDTVYDLYLVANRDYDFSSTSNRIGAGLDVYSFALSRFVPKGVLRNQFEALSTVQNEAITSLID